MLKGFVIICEQDLTIRDVVYDSIENESWKNSTLNLKDICDSEETPKIEEFKKKLTQDGATFNWEINVSFEDFLKPLKFSGSKFDDNFLIFALETNHDVPFLYEELMRINNEQSNYIRKILKERFLQYTEVTDDSKETYDELSKLNNELANLQRELAKKNIELTKLNEIKNQFLGMAAHDLRNPLGNIYGFADLLEDDKESLNEQQQMFVGQIKKQSQFMLNLVSDLLDYSTIEAGEINLNLRETDLNKLISDAVILNESLAERKNISIQFTPSEEPILINIDHDKIEQVITNLLTNAIKYSQPETHVNVTIEINGKEYIVEVKDQGAGIKANELETLFKAFNRTSTQSTAGEKSTGLGLFICKRIINAHHGRIWVTSEVGTGSSFFFSLPKMQ